MTANEIKEQVTMEQVLDSYGIEMKGKMCSCPFHGQDRHPSMKIFKDGFHCFGCGAHGDIFKFVQLMEQCDFKTAFYKLGGSYVKEKKFSDLRKLDKSKRLQEQRKREKAQAQEKLKKINKLIDALQFNLEFIQEGSEEWHETLAELEQCFDEQEKLLKGET